MIRVSVTGLTEARRKLATVGGAAMDAFEGSVIEQTQAVMIASQNAIPVYTGQLRSTAYLRPKKRGRARWWDFGYRSPYAAFIHDHPNGHTNEDGHPCACYAIIHKPRPGMLRNGQGYKWLEKVVKAHGDFARQAIDAVRRAIASGSAGATPAEPKLERSGVAVGALPKSASAARLTRNRALIDAGKRNASGRAGGGFGGGFGSSKEKKTDEEREEEKRRKKQEAESKRALRRYISEMMRLATKRKR